jgi:hypothetical protein
MLEAALLWYKKFQRELEEEGFEFNPYDPCVANCNRKGAQHTLLFHVDDLKSSHKDPKVNDEFEEWLQMKYGEHGKDVAHRGKIHDYLGMELDYSGAGKVKIGMIKYAKNMLEDFPEKLIEKYISKIPAGDDLFNQGQGKKLKTERAEGYHKGFIPMQVRETRYIANICCIVSKSERAKQS